MRRVAMLYIEVRVGESLPTFWLVYLVNPTLGGVPIEISDFPVQLEHTIHPKT